MKYFTKEMTQVSIHEILVWASSVENEEAPLEGAMAETEAIHGCGGSMALKDELKAPFQGILNRESKCRRQNRPWGHNRVLSVRHVSLEVFARLFCRPAVAALKSNRNRVLKKCIIKVPILERVIATAMLISEGLLCVVVTPCITS